MLAPQYRRGALVSRRVGEDRLAFCPGGATRSCGWACSEHPWMCRKGTKSIAVRMASAFFQALSVLHSQRSLSGKALWIAVAAIVAWAMPTLIWFNALTMSPAA